MLKGLKKGGTFLLNTIWDEEETKKRLPDHMKKYLAENNINFYIINATKWLKKLDWETVPIQLCSRHSLKLPM